MSDEAGDNCLIFDGEESCVSVDGLGPGRSRFLRRCRRTSKMGLRYRLASQSLPKSFFHVDFGAWEDGRRIALPLNFWTVALCH